MLRYLNRMPDAAGHGRAGLLVDRDGVLNRRIADGYVLSPTELDLLDAVVPALRRATELGVSIAIVSNQGCISRRSLTEAGLVAIHEKLLDYLTSQGVAVEAIYVCPHHPAAVDPADRTCTCRKPLPGLLEAAAEDLGLDLASSVFIGDQESDRQAAAAAGLPPDRFWLVDAADLDAAAADRLAPDIEAAFRRP